MESDLRARFNADFTPDKYAALVRCVNETEKWPADFRISETPIFLTHDFTDEVTRAAKEIVDAMRTQEFATHAAAAVPKGLEVPNEAKHPNFLVIDFAIIAENARLAPRLIELQAFPSLFGFQLLLLGCIRKAYPVIPRSWTSSFGGIKDEAYLDLLRRTIIADSPPESVILLEIDPEKQKTRVDFAATERLLGVRPVCVTKVKKHSRQLFYDLDGREVRIERIYNRVIFDELSQRPDLKLAFRFQDDLDVTWVGHPNWYFRISKHSLPFLKTEHTSPAFLADEFPAFANQPSHEAAASRETTAGAPADDKIDNYVLKPLYSFAGHGVDMEPTREKIAALENPHEWILQKKIDYAAFVPTVDGQKSKAEIRMMFVWPEHDRDPTLVNNLVRMSQGKMMGVDFNIDKTWVGASIALHESETELKALKS